MDIPKNQIKKLCEYIKCNQEDILKCLEIQEKASDRKHLKRIGDILLDEGMVSQKEYDSAVFAQRIDRLRGCSLFSSLTKTELKIISKGVEEVSFNKKAKLFSQGDSGDYFYVVGYGEALVYRRGDYDEKIPLSIIKSGDSVGEMSYFASRKRLATVETLTACHMLKISYDSLEDFFMICPGLTRNFLNLITLRLKETNIRFQDSFNRTRQTEKALKYMSDIMDMTDISALHSGINGLIERIVTTASKAMNCERATLFLLDPFSNGLLTKVAVGIENREIRLPINKGVAGWVATNNQIVNINDAYGDERFDPSMDNFFGFKTRNILCGPLKNLQGETIGVIQLINKQGGNFKNKDETLLKAFAYQTAIAVENFYLCQKIVEDQEQRAVFYDISNSVAQTSDLDSLFEIIVNKITTVFSAERSSLFLLDNKSNELWSRVAKKSEIKEIRFPVTQGLAGHVARSGKILNIKNAYKDARFSAAFDKKTGFKTKMVLCAPVINRDGIIIGVVQVINKKEGYYIKKDEELLSVISSQIAVALTTAQLIQNLKELISAFLKSMASAIDEKSPYTGGHIKRVVDLCMRLARKISDSSSENFKDTFFSDNEMEELRIAAWMHDIGKIVTPQHIIDKASRLEKLIDRIEIIETRFHLIETLIQMEFANKKNAYDKTKESVESSIKQIENDLDKKILIVRTDLIFIKSCNNPDNFMTQEKIDRIKAIAKNIYTFNNKMLPYLSDDEVKNLCIPKGTLTDEERKIVENHAVATQKITEVLPFPDHLSRVSEFASSHHEKLDGTGYPNRLAKKNLAIQSRILAIADIFEALTAKDRPYRDPMKVSQAIKIMELMKNDNHIDGKIYDFFINTGVFREYAEQHLNPAQIDMDI
jgi:HD-GYP domain-containing protein (c-di-GMP phosphodiesterase class II)/CRP-like cAMP-binding protein